MLDGLLGESKFAVQNGFRNHFLMSAWIPRRIRLALLRMLPGVSLADGVSFGFGCKMTSTCRITVGSNTFVNNGCQFLGEGEIVIGANCAIGYDVMFCTSTHLVGAAGQRAGEYVYAPISVGNGVWVGARATILAGVSIRGGCIIGAGAVVTKDCSIDGLYTGVPAGRIRDLSKESR
jgi:maltose O-acetyltransferase